VKLGYTDVWNLDGGMIGWKAAGQSLLSKPQ
jgi:rhodanese-related sulfurtransferase